MSMKNRPEIKNEKLKQYAKISNKRLLMQYMRLIPAKLGLINKAAFLHQIRRIYPDDIFVVSYPKSGNTWLRFIIAYIKRGTQKDISFKDLEQIVPDVYTSKDFIDSQKAHRIIKSHDIFFNYYNKVIYIYRDYRDVLVSFYHFQVGLQVFSGTFSEFIRGGYMDAHGNWKQHVSAAIKFKNEKPEHCLLLSYEDLLENFEENARKIAQFCNLDTDVDWNAIKQKTSFDDLKENENKYGSRFFDISKKNFLREGKAGVWKNVFSKEDLEYLYADKELLHIMQSLGYSC